MRDAYATQAAALNAEILEVVQRRAIDDFNGLALRIFAHQLRYNQPYARYCESLGVSLAALPSSWQRIPPVPAAAYKEFALCTFDPQNAELVFETSGTTSGAGGKHYMEFASLYDASLLAGFHDAIAARSDRPLRYILLVPNPAREPRSSLGYMMNRVARAFGDGEAAWCLEGSALPAGRVLEAIGAARTQGVPVCLTATAFALVQLMDALPELARDRCALPAGSLIVETGGFKGKTRAVSREALYRDAARLFSVPPEAIVSEYGMTELTSQYYDDAQRVKRAPPWLRPRVVGADGTELARGTAGAIVHVDLANRSSCVAIATDDLGVAVDEDGIALIGREQGAELRGCSLDAEQLLARL